MIRNVLTSQKQISGVFLTRNWIQNGASYCIVLQQLIIIWPAEKQWILYFLSVITFCVNLWKYPNPVTRCMTNKLCHLVSHVNRCISSPFFFCIPKKVFYRLSCVKLRLYLFQSCRFDLHFLWLGTSQFVWERTSIFTAARYVCRSETNTRRDRKADMGERGRKVFARSGMPGLGVERCG